MQEAYCTYAEEADDAANKVSRRKRIGMALFQIYRLTIDNKFPLFELIDNHVQGSFFIIKGNDQ